MRKIIRLLISTSILAVSLRFFYFNISPPGFYSDEADQGYNAYSLLKTGKDEHGEFLPISLRSFGDWKPPVQTYLAIPFIAVLGLNEYAVRLPSMILGVLSIVIAFYLLKALKFNSKIALLTSFFLAISPWHLHQSRSAMLVMVAFFFFLTGVLFFIRGGKFFLIFSALAFALSIYSYYGMRLIVPLFIMFGFLLQRRKVNLLRSIVVFFLAFIFFLVPLLIAFIAEPNVIFGRAKTVSVFYDRGIELRIWELAAQEGQGNVFMVRFFHNKLYFYLIDISRRLFSHLEGKFLFLKGDTVPPFRIPNMGVLYLFDGLLIPVGLWRLWKWRRKQAIFFSILLFISLLPAALTFMTPSANRTFNSVLPLLVFSTVAICSLLGRFKKFKYKLATVIIIVLIYIIQFQFYLNNYYYILPEYYAKDWIYGIKEMVKSVQSYESQYDRIVVLPNTNIAYIYFLFYANTNPLDLAASIERDYTTDEFGFEHVAQMDKYIFMREGGLFDVREKYKGKVLFVGREREITSGKILNKIRYPNGKVSFTIAQ